MFVCSECNTVCDSLAILKYHKKVVHGAGKLYECEFCGKKCITNSQLKIHLRTREYYIRRKKLGFDFFFLQTPERGLLNAPTASKVSDGRVI